MSDIMDNIRLGVENASEEDVIEACRMANAHEFIRNFPEVWNCGVSRDWHCRNRDTPLPLERRVDLFLEGRNNESPLREH